VLATLHTNDSAAAVTRLLDMGIEPFLLSSSLLGVLAQRLVRKLCEACRTQDREGHWHPVGCPACGNTGYDGRTGIHELLVVDDAVREAIHGRQAERVLRGLARERGFRPMIEDGERWLAAGVTSPKELARVTREQ
jgi:general secretion pathway protein E